MNTVHPGIFREKFFFLNILNSIKIKSNQINFDKKNFEK